MAIERPIIGITTDEITNEAENFDSKEYMQDFKPALLQEVLDHHKPLSNVFHMHRKNHGPKYVNSALMSYGLVVDRLNSLGIQVEFGIGEMQAHYKGRVAVTRSLKDEDLDPARWQDMLLDEEIKSPFADFLTDLYYTSPDYFEYVQEEVANTSQTTIRRDIVLGVYDGVMPFFGRLESAHLQQIWDNPAQLDETHPEWVDEPANTLSPAELRQLENVIIEPQRRNIK